MRLRRRHRDDWWLPSGLARVLRVGPSPVAEARPEPVPADRPLTPA